MTHRLGLVSYDGFLHAWVLDLPGCVVGGRDLDEVEEILPLAIAEYTVWLREHGGTAAEHRRWSVTETLDARPFESVGGEFCFAEERASLTPSQLETAIARMDYARSDLLNAIRPLPNAVLDWLPSASSVAAFDAWAPEVRTIRGIVRHVLQLEAYYRDGLHDGDAVGIFEEVADPAAERGRTVELLRSLNEAGRGRVFRSRRPGRTIAEEWTVRKVVRRIISHERAHTAEIVQRRTWLLLGVPQIGRQKAEG
jgi:hypothetical protein